MNIKYLIETRILEWVFWKILQLKAHKINDNKHFYSNDKTKLNGI